MTDFFDINMQIDDINVISNLGLAHIGDAVFEIMVRSWLILQGKATSKGLHKATVYFVKAPSQAAMSARIQDMLTEEEAGVFRRARNASPHSVPKAASREEYQLATAVEALFGYLYLQGKKERLNELFAAMIADQM